MKRTQRRLLTAALALGIGLAGLKLAADEPKASVEGSIKTTKEAMLDYPFLDKLGMEKAIQIAEAKVTEGSLTAGYLLMNEAGYLAWTFWFTMPDKGQMRVEVDAGDGKVLFSGVEAPKKEESK
jgi:hypothetical protein